MATLFAFLIFLLAVLGGSAADRTLAAAAIHDALTTDIARLRVTPATAESVTLRDLAQARELVIGAATEAVPLVREPDFARLLGTQFSLLTTENRLKFNIVHPERDRYDFTQGDVIVRFAEANGMKVRGHCLVWHEHFPVWLDHGRVSTTEAQHLVREHIRAVMQHYAGRIAYWDVVNEAILDDGKMRDSKWRQLLGPDYIASAFRWAREADPHAKLFLNDYGCETICPKSDALLRLVQQLQVEHVPIDGIGFQMHCNLAAGLSTVSLQRNLERFAKLGLELHITEMDVGMAQTGVTTVTLEREARLFRDVLQTALAFPQMKAVIFWGASDRHSWLTQKKSPVDAPLLFDRELKPKPAFDGVVEALRSL